MRCLSGAHAGQTWQQVERLLRLDWSPEQIAGRLKLENSTVSLSDLSACLCRQTTRRHAPRHLRSQKKQRKRYSGYIPGRSQRTSIEQRPQIVASKRATVTGRPTDHCADIRRILSLVERNPS